MPPEFKFSYSASNTYNGCERKYWYEKVANVPVDPDYTDDARALIVGKAFHSALEACRHDKSVFKPDMVHNACVEHGVVYPSDRGMILAMCYRYMNLHARSGLTVVVCEIRVGNEGVVGYIDAVMIDRNGYWWIVDLKTAAMLNNFLLSRLGNDPQLNLYAYFAPDVAADLRLDLEKFRGVRYRVTTKTRKVPKKQETTDSFMKRIYKEDIESFDIGIPVEELDPEGTYARFMELRGRVERTWLSKEEDVPQNFGNCESYRRPCPYWSRCYGDTFTGAARTRAIFDSTNIIDLTHSPQGADDEDDALFV